MKKRILVFSALLILSSCQLQKAPALEKELDQLLEKRNSVGLSVAVVKDGEIIYSGAFGKKNLEEDLPLQTSDLFRIASISKSFSATAIMQLVEEGRISLEDDVSNLIGFRVRNPAYPDEVITLEMLLSHRSGISDKNGYFTLDRINPEIPGWEQSYNDYPPGADYEYCNLCFNMVGAILENLTGERFDRYIVQKILDPLGIEGGYNVSDLDPDRLASLYAYDPETESFRHSPSAYDPRKEEIADYTPGYSAPIFSPTGGMKMSAPDLARYMIMHMNYGRSGDVRILSEESARRMQTPLTEKNGYGLALHSFDQVIPGKTLIGHTGSAYGLYSVMLFDPAEKFGFVAITNGVRSGEKNGVNHFLNDVVQILYRGLIE